MNTNIVVKTKHRTGQLSCAVLLCGFECNFQFIRQCIAVKPEMTADCAASLQRIFFAAELSAVVDEEWNPLCISPVGNDADMMLAECDDIACLPCGNVSRIGSECLCVF